LDSLGAEAGGSVRDPSIGGDGSTFEDGSRQRSHLKKADFPGGNWSNSTGYELFIFANLSLLFREE
jgi:hypothetical protein